MDSYVALKPAEAVTYDENHPFPLENIPFGVFRRKDGVVHCCTRIADKVIDLAELFNDKVFSGPLMSALTENPFDQPNLNKFAAMGKGHRQEVRATLQEYFSASNNKLWTEGNSVLHNLDDV